MLTEALLTIANMWEKNGLLIYLQYGGTLKPLCLVNKPDTEGLILYDSFHIKYLE